MTARSMLEFLRERTGQKTVSGLARAIGLTKGEASKILNGAHERGMRMSTIKQMHINTGVPIGELAELWAEAPPPKTVEKVEAIDKLWHAKIRRAATNPETKPS